jgi:hypothetical protein
MKDYGQAVTWGWISLNHEVDADGDIRRVGYTAECDRAEIMAALKADAAMTLGPGRRFELRTQPATNYGRTHHMAWYAYEPNEEAEWPVGDLDPPLHVPETGIYLIGRYVT